MPSHLIELTAFAAVTIALNVVAFVWARRQSRPLAPVVELARVRERRRR